jgi:hypothetical protein
MSTARLEQLQEEYSRASGYLVERGAGGLWARPSWITGTMTLDQLALADFAKLPAMGVAPAVIERLKAGWFGLSRGNNPDLDDIIGRAGRLIAGRHDRLSDTPVGLTFFSQFNAAAHWAPSAVLLHIPLVASLDVLNTFARELMVWRDEPALTPPSRLQTIRSVVADGLDFIVVRKKWMSAEMARMLQIYRDTARGPDDRWQRFGYACALTQRCWILLHEYGHVALNHDPRARGLDAQEHEFAADAFATDAFAQAPPGAKNDMFPLALALPWFFDFLDAAERRLPDPPPDSTHPTAAQRRARVRERVADWYEGAAGDAAFASVGL